MAERAIDDEGESCFVDEGGDIGWVDDNGNWLGYVPEKGDVQCLPAGLRALTVRCVAARATEPD